MHFWRLLTSIQTLFQLWPNKRCSILKAKILCRNVACISQSMSILCFTLLLHPNRFNIDSIRQHLQSILTSIDKAYWHYWLTPLSLIAPFYCTAIIDRRNTNIIYVGDRYACSSDTHEIVSTHIATNLHIPVWELCQMLCQQLASPELLFVPGILPEKEESH